MKPRIVVDHESWGSVTTMLRNLGTKVPANAARAMRRAAIRIRDRAETYTPEDEADLAESIRVVEKRGARGRLEIDIIAGGLVVTKDNGRVVDLNSYAVLIHEAYSSMKPGPNTLKKRAIYGEEKVGERFMDRAVEDDGQAAYHEILKIVTETINGESKKADIR